MKKEEKEDYKLIRNFSIIAHVDHGKSTLADRIIELTNFKNLKKPLNRILDSLALEQQKGITIKLNAVQLKYLDERTKKNYTFNLIDTPGHADFGYEVSRSLAACEGVILLVDSTKGVQAQTLAYLQIAKNLNLKFIPVINKIDLPSAQIEKVQNQLTQLLDCDQDDFCFISSKTGKNVPLLLEKIVDKIPSPLKKEGPLKALIFDLLYDKYYGVIVYIRIFEGSIELKQKIKFLHNNKIFQVEKIGIKKPENQLKDKLEIGEIGWFTANIREMKDVRVGDTVSDAMEKTDSLPGYKILKSNLYSNIYPEETIRYKDLKKAIEELQIQDNSLQLEPIESNLLGPGFRCGFLGLLHQEVIQERIKQEYELEIITTPPSVTYQLNLYNGKILEISNPQKFPSLNEVRSISELFISLTITTPEKYLGSVNIVCQNKRGIYKNGDLKAGDLWQINYEMPFAEFIFDFNDKVKSVSQGYASFEYEFIGFREAKIVKVDILLNNEAVSDLSFLVHQIFAYERSRDICIKLKETLNPQNFEVPIQACIGKKIISRETLKAMRKDVIGKCYGGDITRKKKLLEKQKKGKKKMKEMGSVSFSKSSFRNILKERRK
ncbi:MAG: Elongation factor 4 [Mycoplasmataceae bacterium]|nr:MAG: Elongation factor 4 [Mycoplasmataceae bacterium]